MNPVKVRTYPLGAYHNMTEIVCPTEVEGLPIYRDAKGDLWEPNLATEISPWYSKVTNPKTRKEYLQKEEKE
jgi:hypothetical protein